MSLELSGMDMGLPGTFHISPGMYASLPMYILYMFLGQTWTYQVHSIYVPRTPWDGHVPTRYIPYHPGIYVGLPCTYYICPWDFLGMDIDLPGTFSAIHPWNAHMSLDSLGWTCTYQV